MYPRLSAYSFVCLIVCLVCVCLCMVCLLSCLRKCPLSYLRVSSPAIYLLPSILYNAHTWLVSRRGGAFQVLRVVLPTLLLPAACCCDPCFRSTTGGLIYMKYEYVRITCF